MNKFYKRPIKYAELYFWQCCKIKTFHAPKDMTDTLLGKLLTFNVSSSDLILF